MPCCGLNGKDAIDVTKSLRSDRNRSRAGVGHGGNGAPAHGKRHVVRRWHGYGFLPGYRTPEQIEADEARHARRVWWYGGPGFYHGRWNGGGFGPCWTQTPIGNVWNCGK